MVGDKAVNPAKGHFTWDNKPKGFDVDQMFVSPSIKYSGCEVYAKATQQVKKCHKANKLMYAKVSVLSLNHLAIYSPKP